MDILLTNDDGIDSEGLQKLADALRSKHRVYVVAPDSNRSGVSHGITMLNAPVKLSALGEDTFSCSGNPADCVIAALLGALPVKPDLVLSGINRGENMGTDIIYSGTAAAARQGSLAGIPAVALSLAGSGEYHWDMAVSWTVDHLEELLACWKPETFVNVNIPNSPSGPEGMLLTAVGRKNYRDTLSIFNAPDNSRWCFLEFGEETGTNEAGTDCDAVFRNFVSVSPVYNHPSAMIEQGTENG